MIIIMILQNLGFKSLGFGKIKRKSIELNRQALLNTEMYYEAIKEIDHDISFIGDIVKA